MEDLSWPLSSVVYQLYPRSFKDSNGDGIGDIKGILEKIDHLKNLGITAVWLNPIYPSPQADFGYDVADYTDIDPIYGTMDNFKLLVKKLHDNNIKVMMDFVPNHTSSHHKWFAESKSSKDNAKRDWYLWKDGKADGSPPNNWKSHFGGSGWEKDNTTGQYYFHSFDVHQPDLNWRNPQVVEAMLNVLRFWMNNGVDGFRVDVANHMFKDSLFRDEPPNPNFNESTHGEYDMVLHTYTRDLPEYMDMIKKFIDVLKEYNGKFMVTEAWVTLPELIKLYVTIGWKYYAPFNFSFTLFPWRADVHKKYIDEYDKALGDLYIPCYVLGNHDRNRIASKIGPAQARVAAMAQLTLRGIPFVYYGEEIGMTDVAIPKDKIQDTYEKRSPGLGLGRDPQRTPLQWNTNTNAGFSTGEPWLPVSEKYTEVNVENQSKDPKSILSLYKTLIKLRKTKSALIDGNYVPLPHPAENVLAYIRQKGNEQLLVVLNFDEKEKKISLTFPKAKMICNTFLDTQFDAADLQNFTLKGNEGCIFEIN